MCQYSTSCVTRFPDKFFPDQYLIYESAYWSNQKKFLLKLNIPVYNHLQLNMLVTKMSFWSSVKRCRAKWLWKNESYFVLAPTSSVDLNKVSAAGPYSALSFILPCLKKFKLEAEIEDKKVFPVDLVWQSP